MPFASKNPTFIDTIMKAQIYAKDIGALIIWTIYDHPTDYPNGFIARAYEVTKVGTRATSFVIEALNLEIIREAFILSGLSCLSRSNKDDAKIVENWL